MLYELMVIARAGDSDAVLSRVEKNLKDVGALNLKLEKLGKKVLAYPIAKQTEGEYAVFNFEAEPGVIGQIGDSLRLEREAVLRYLVIKSKPKKAVGKAREIKEKQEAPKATVTVKTRIEKKPEKVKLSRASKKQMTSKAKSATKKKGKKTRNR